MTDRCPKCGAAYTGMDLEGFAIYKCGSEERDNQYTRTVTCYESQLAAYQAERDALKVRLAMVKALTEKLCNQTFLDVHTAETILSQYEKILSSTPAPLAVVEVPLDKDGRFALPGENFICDYNGDKVVVIIMPKEDAS